MSHFEVFREKNVLLLQSQFIFFWRLARDLKSIAKSVYKINFNGGDFIFYFTKAINYTGHPDGIEDFLRECIGKYNIGAIVVFNDCKPVHRIAKKVASELNIDFFVFEQGYIRPDFITFEKGGVNGFSSLPRNPEVYRSFNLRPSCSIKKVGHVETYRIIYSLIYYFFFVLLKPFFKSSDYSVPGIHRYAWGLVKGRILKFFHDLKKGEVSEFVKKYKNRYYFVPLQMSVDSQIRTHSPYRDVYEFIDEVIQSFSRCAPEEYFLVFKHHPFDLGLNDYTEFIRKKVLQFGVKDRVFYFKTGDVDELIQNSIGCILVNSTCGLNVLNHGKPLKVMGKAIYDIEGMVYKRKLDDFWRDALHFKPDSELIQRFISYVILKTQINGSFYKRITPENHTGLVFPVEDKTFISSEEKWRRGYENSERY